MARTSPRRSNGRRSPWAAAALIGIGLLITGGVYAGASAAMAATDRHRRSASALTVEDGKKLFQANCATCHGLDLQGTADGPSLYGVGELAVEFQVATGRMPMAMQGPQAPQKPVQFTAGPDRRDGRLRADARLPARPSPTRRSSTARATSRAAPSSSASTARCATTSQRPAVRSPRASTHRRCTRRAPLHMYAAMVTGPQNMPVFNDMNLTTEDKRDIISALLFLQENESPGGFSLGSLGPVSEGLFIWIFGIGALIAITVWITAKSN